MERKLTAGKRGRGKRRWVAEIKSYRGRYMRNVESSSKEGEKG